MPNGSTESRLLDRSTVEVAGGEDAGNSETPQHAVRPGARQAFDQFAKRYLDRLYAFARRLTGDAHLAEDVVQEVLVRAYRKAPQSEAELERWLFVVARNVALNAIRSRGRRRAKRLVDCPEPVAERQEDQLEADERRRMIEEALAELPEEQRAAIVLAKYHGRTCGQIAEILGCSVSAVKMRISRGMRRLRSTLATWAETGST